MAEAGIKASKLAENACISKGYVSGLLSGTKEAPSFEVVKKIAEVLSCSPTFLLYGLEKGQESESVLREEPPEYRVKSNPSPLRSPNEPTILERMETLQRGYDETREALADANRKLDALMDLFTKMPKS